MNTLIIREVESNLAMRQSFGFPAVFYVAQPENGASQHAAGDTPEEARENWIKRHAH